MVNSGVPTAIGGITLVCRVTFDLKMLYFHLFFLKKRTDMH